MTVSNVGGLAFVVAVLCLFLVGTLQPIALSVSRRQGFPGMSTVAEIRIPRHAENREACVTLSAGGELEDQSCWELTAHSSPVFRRTWKGLAGGQHVAQARLLRGRETWFSNVVELHVADEEP